MAAATKEIRAAVKAIRPLIGKEVNVIKDEYTIKARLLGYTISVGTFTETLSVIIEDENGWSLITEILDEKDKVYKKFLDKGLYAKYESPYMIQGFEDTPCVAFLK